MGDWDVVSTAASDWDVVESKPESSGKQNYTQTLIPEGAQIRAGGKRNWLDSLENDVRYGGTETMPGKVMAFLGAKGINRGVSEGAADKVASPIVGTINAARGIAETPQHPIMGPIHAIGGALQAAELPMAFMGGPGANKAINAIPSRAHAGQMLSEVKEAAGNVPINANTAGDVALNISKLAKSGGSMPKVVRDFLKRVTDPTAEPMTLAEARDFYSNATRLSANEFNRLTPVMQRQAAIFTKALGKSIQDAASTVGRGEQYASGMKEYAQAMKLKGYSDAAINFFIKKMIPAGLVGAAGYEAYKLTRK